MSSSTLRKAVIRASLLCRSRAPLAQNIEALNVGARWSRLTHSAAGCGSLAVPATRAYWGSSSIRSSASKSLSSYTAAIESSRSFSAAASDLPSFEELPMPSLSPTMTEGNIASWKLKEGDKISAGDVLADIETDKATMDMESMEDGYLAKILVPAGTQNVAVGTTLAIIVEDKADCAAFANYSPSAAPAAPAAAPAAPITAPTPAAPSPSTPAVPAAAPPVRKDSSARVFASPLARKLAAERGIKISNVTGTGPMGRIIKADVEEHKEAAAAETVATSEFPSWMFPDYTDMPVKMIQKITAQRLTQSKQEIPHYYLSVDVQMDKLMAIRAQLNGGLAASKSETKLSVTDFIIKASAVALMRVPAVNSSWMDDKIRTYHAADISVAVQTDHGLMVPIVRDADTKGLSSISSDVKSLATKARENKLTPAEYSGGTFTISNLGMFGVKQFCAIVNPPQACILAVGSSEKRVIPGKVEGTYEEGSFMCATISCDHRVVDGAVAAQWLAEFKKLMEDPMTILL